MPVSRVRVNCVIHFLAESVSHQSILSDDVLLAFVRSNSIVHQMTWNFGIGIFILALRKTVTNIVFGVN